jgi:hypothetical protein
MFRTNENGTVYLCLYVDDFLLLGDEKDISEVLEEIKSAYLVKELGEVENFVRCKIKFEKGSVFLSQPDIIKKMENDFGEELVQGLGEYKTPGTPGEGIVRPSAVDELICESDQKIFRSGIGSLLYLMKDSCPVISNAVRELSNVMDGATPAHLKSLYRTIKFVFDTKNRGLLLSPNKNEEIMELRGRSDSDYAGNKNTRQSGSGYVVYLNDALIAWRSKA